jgi:signal transduction histidine kinase
MKRSRALTPSVITDATLAATIILATFCFTYFTNSTRGLPFRDSFSAGKTDEWQPIGGAWETANGLMRNESDERGAKLLAGSKRWKNYVVETDLKLLRQGGDVGVIVRSSHEERGVDSYNGYYVGLRSGDNSLLLGRADYGWMEGRPVPMPGGVHSLSWYHLKVVVFGCAVGAFANEIGTNNSTSALLEETDCVPAGRIGLRSTASAAAWRNVRVSAATPEDLSAIRRHAPSIIQPEFPKSEAAFNATHPFHSSPLSYSDDAVQALSGMPEKALVRQPISSLRALPQPSSHPVLVRGVVVLTSPILYVQDSTGGVAVPDSHTPALGIGDEVEIAGWAEPNDYSAILRNARVKLLWDRTPVAPFAITAAQAATGAFDATFVETQGYLRSKRRGSDNTVIFDLDDSSQSFRAIANGASSDDLYRRFSEHSLLRVRGICVLDSRFTQQTAPFVLLLRSADDLDLIAGPPWWTTPRLVELTCTLLLLFLLIDFLYIRLEHWRLRGIMQERERLAHEMHDTLAQSFAGIGFQLQGIRNGIRHGWPKSLPTINQQLDRACDIVRQTHEEASLSIAMLRPESPEFCDLALSFERYASGIVSGGITVDITSNGSVKALPLRVTDALFHIGREAIANAIRHAQATKIDVILAYETDTVTLIVEDCGLGFTRSSDVRGLGLRAMEQRTQSISADLQIDSIPGKGTRIKVIAPLAPQIGFTDLPKYLFNHLFRNRLYVWARDAKRGY